ncbi:MAG: L-threonylcarbamoyladenylate synthase [Microthrixaceae bacterium]
MSNVDHSEPRSETVKVDPSTPDHGVLVRAGAILRSGGLVAFPTETVYGLGANALDASAIEAVFRAKGRPATDPLIVHIASLEQAESLTTQWTPGAVALAEAFWPGPLTLVLPKSPTIGDSITAGRPTVALRVPSHPVAHLLIEAADVPIAAPSANRFGRISPTTAAHVEDELAGSYELLLDGGATTIGVESSVVDLSTGRPVLLRPGGITLEALRQIVPEIEFVERTARAEEVAADAPGQFLRHYSPRTSLVLVDGGDTLVDELCASLKDEGVQISVLDLSEEPDVAARELYSRLRIADSSGATLILAPVYADSGIGRAVNDRLFRAAHGRIAADSMKSTVTDLARLSAEPG